MGNVTSYITGGDSAPKTPPTPPQSAYGLLLTLAPTLIPAVIVFSIFLVLRRTKRRFYAPRTYLGSLHEHERSPQLPSGLFNWFRAFAKIPDEYALRQRSLDAFLFLRFLRVCFFICVVGICLTWPILIPINATGGGGQTQLEILSYSNVDIHTSGGKNRLIAHALVGWLFFGFVLYTIMRECVYYTNLRQAYLLAPQTATRISSRTVLLTSVPLPYLDAAKIRKLFGESVKHVWITHDSSKVDDLVQKRDKIAMSLEKAEVKLLKTVNKTRLEAIKKGVEPNAEAHPSTDPESGSRANRTISSRVIPDSQRPSHKLGLLGLFGTKVDSIDYCRTELARLIPETEAAQRSYRAGECPKVSAVFVEFLTQSDAQAAYQILTHHQAFHMTPKMIGISPNQVVWKSLRLPWWQRVIRNYAVFAFIAALIIFWAIPVAIVGIVSQVSTLEKIPFLTWLAKIPKPVLGLISGLLPGIALAILMSLVPVVMRLCARLAGEVSESSVELYCQQAYFIFQVVELFLVQTISSSAATVLVQVAENPSSILSTLSSAIPTASNTYISYFIVQGLTIASGVISQVVGFFVFSLIYKYLSGTPRAMFNKWTQLSRNQWGSLMPVFTGIVVIALTYSIITPFILFWAALALGLFYLAYRYNVLFVSETDVDTQGLIYPRALKQLLFGVYLAEICLIAMFAVSAATGAIILMIAFLVFTILFHLTLSTVLGPLLNNLPRSLLIEEESFHTDLSAAAVVDSNEHNSKSENATSTTSPDVAASAAPSRGNIVNRFLMPWRYDDYLSLRSLIPHDDTNPTQYADEVESVSFFPPSIFQEPPTLWIPQDPAGVSKEEITHTGAIIPITDEGCTLDDKNNLVWDAEGARPPIWDEKVIY